MAGLPQHANVTPGVQAAEVATQVTDGVETPSMPWVVFVSTQLNEFNTTFNTESGPLRSIYYTS
jgi:hypothetical protein